MNTIMIETYTKDGIEYILKENMPERSQLCDDCAFFYNIGCGESPDCSYGKDVSMHNFIWIKKE